MSTQNQKRLKNTKLQYAVQNLTNELYCGSYGLSGVHISPENNFFGEKLSRRKCFISAISNLPRFALIFRKTLEYESFWHIHQTTSPEFVKSVI
jgi:hypothetical protein